MIRRFIVWLLPVDVRTRLGVALDKAFDDSDAARRQERRYKKLYPLLPELEAFVLSVRDMMPFQTYSVVAKASELARKIDHAAFDQ